MSQGPARPGDPAHLEELLRHRDFVRRLARRLVRDEARAEDVVQDTYVAALRNPPRHAGALRAWLASVVRKIAFTHRRSEQRRRDREEQAPPGRPLPAPEEVAERAQWHQRVVNAVMELDEPYRSTLLLRYFEDLNSSEIARVHDVPPATVRTRVKRGLEQLRDRLDGEAGGDRAAWLHGLLLLGWRPDELAAAARAARWPDPATLVPLAAAAAGVIAVLGLGLVWHSGSEAGEAVPRAVPPERTAAGSGRAFVLAPPPAGAPLEVTVLGDGRRVPGATVVLARRQGHPWRFSARDRWVEWDRGAADDRGVARFDGVPAGFVRVFAAADGFARGVATVSRPRAFASPIVVELARERPLRFRVVEARTDEPVPGALVRLADWTPPARARAGPDGRGVLRGVPADGRCRVLASADGYAPGPGRAPPDARRDTLLLHLEPRRRTVRWPVRRGPPDGTPLTVRPLTEAHGRPGRVEDGAVVAGGFGPGVVPELVAIAPDGAFARLRLPGESVTFGRPSRLSVRVRDPDGPAEGVDVRLTNAAGHALPPGATTGPKGRATLPVYAPDPVAVRVRDGAHAVFRTVGRYDPADGPETLDVTLPPGRTVLLTVRDGLPPGAEILAGRSLVRPTRTPAGARRFRVRGADPVAVHVLAPGFLPATRVLDPSVAGPARVAVELVRGCELRVQVVRRSPRQPLRLDLVRAEGGPDEGARDDGIRDERIREDGTRDDGVRDGDTPPLRRGPWEFRLYVGPDGVVRETMLPPGRYRVRDRVTGVVSDAFRAGPRLARVRLDVSRAWPPAPRDVRGRVAGAHGLDPGDAVVVVVPHEGGEGRRVPVSRDGEFRFPWTDGEPVRVSVRHPHAAPGKEVTLTGPRGDLALALEPHRARFRLDPKPGPLAVYETAPRVRVAWDGGARTLDAALQDGALSFSGFPPGRADLWIDVAGFAPAVLLGVELRPGETDLGTLRLHRGGRVRLRVIGRAGEPLPSLIVSAQGDRYQRSLHTRGAEIATLAGLGRGSFRITAWESPGGFPVFRASIRSDGESTYDLEIDLR